MPEKKHEPEPEAVRIVDRRRFTSEGDRRPDVEEPVPSMRSPAPDTPVTPADSGAGRGSESAQSRSARQAYERQAPPADMKMDFEALVSSLYTTTLYHFSQQPPDLVAARQSVDMLKVIQDKTRGNLTPRESQLLEQALYELRLSFVALSSGGGKPKGGGADS